MSLRKQPFDNKTHYDPGRMRHGIAIMNYAVADNGSGGESLTEQFLIGTRAGKEKVSDYKKAQIVAGITNYESAVYFVIRNRPNFYPDKTMHVNFGASSYTILEVTELDDPCTFLRLLCVVTV